MSAERLLALAQILHATRQQEAATQDDIGEVGTRGQGAFELVARGRFEHFQTVYPDQRTVHLVDMHTGQIVIRNLQRCRRSPQEWLAWARYFVARVDRAPARWKRSAAQRLTAAEALRLLEGLCASTLDRLRDWGGS